MIPLDPARKEGHQIYHFGVRCSFRSTPAEKNKPRNGDDSCFSDGEKGEELIGVDSNAAIRAAH